MIGSLVWGRVRIKIGIRVKVRVRLMLAFIIGEVVGGAMVAHSVVPVAVAFLM